jgi:SNF2 family DNA or RNA helicase
MLANENRSHVQGAVTITRDSAGWRVSFDGFALDAKEVGNGRIFSHADFLGWVNGCSVTDGMRLEHSDRISFPIGTQPVRGRRCPSLGELLLPLLLPAVLPESLYPFQVEGIKWLGQTPRAILADDMGLGKTVQVLVALEQLFTTHLGAQALIVAPKTLVPNWLKESSTWIPRLVVRSANEIGAGSYRGSSHVVVCSYEDLISNARLREEPWIAVVADEAHRLRTGASERARRFRDLKSDRCWLLTGTPIEHSPADLAMLLSYLDPVRFSARALISAPDTVRPAAMPFLLRRLKLDVLGELPDAHRSDIELDFTPTQSRRYFEVLLGQDGVKRIHLQKLSICRAICDIDSDSDASSKLDWLEAFVEHQLPTDEKVVVFSVYLPVLRAAMRRLRNIKPGLCQYISGDTPSAERSEIVNAFQRDGGARVLLLSMGVGAEGLTLTRANHVVFLNEWWNPSLNQQARDRVLRIGQHRVVHEYRLLVRRSIEQRIRDVIKHKQCSITEIVDALAGRGDCPDIFRELETSG